MFSRHIEEIVSSGITNLPPSDQQQTNSFLNVKEEGGTHGSILFWNRTCCQFQEMGRAYQERTYKYTLLATETSIMGK